MLIDFESKHQALICDLGDLNFLWLEERKAAGSRCGILFRLKGILAPRNLGSDFQALLRAKTE